MGERLTVSIIADNEPFAGIYYHWGAYTEAALNIANHIIQTLGDYENKTTSQMQMELIKMCENDGGGINGGVDSDEWKHITSKFPMNFRRRGIDRNNGLIALSEDGINGLESWATPLSISLDTGLIYNYCYGDRFLSYESYCETCNDCEIEPEKFSNIKQIPYDIELIACDELPWVQAELSHCNNVCRCGDMIYMLIT